MTPQRRLASALRAMRPRPGAAAVLAVLVAGAGAALASGNRWGADYFPDVTLLTQDGQTVRFYEDLVKGKRVAINVIYTKCVDECPLETARMAEVQRLLGERVGRDVFFYSISIDPAHDTPRVLKAYAGKFGVGPGWLFLTGRKEDIRLLTKKLGLSRTSDLFNKDGHATSLMLGNDPRGQWMRASAVDNPRFIASSMASFFEWKDALPTQGYDQAKLLDVGNAQYLFQSRCSACHTIGGGDRIGPDLMNVTERRPRPWLARYLVEPDKVRAEGDATARALHQKFGQVPMPNLGLGSQEAAGLLAWIEQSSKAAAAAPTTAGPARPAHQHQHGHQHHGPSGGPAAQAPAGGAR